MGRRKVGLSITHEQVWGRVAIDLDGCWLWTGTVNRHGYGRVKIGGRTGPVVLVHRLLDELRNGPLPKGVCVLHRCDTPACVRADHLWRGTQADNIRDMDAKGRGRRHYEILYGRKT